MLVRAQHGLVPLWFGTPRLPESVDAEVVRAERSRADAAGIRPVAQERIRSVLRKPLDLAGKSDLLREAAALVELYAADEKERAAALAGRVE